MEKIYIPLDVPESQYKTYTNNYTSITHGSGRLMLMAADQKVEHLNDDFIGPGISEEDNDPEHFFKIASKAKIGAFASQLGLVARYASDYPKITYIIKLNSKTNLVKTKQKDPLSLQWQTIEQINRLKKQAGLNIAGIGYTIYPGSEFEHLMFTEVSRLIFEAHQLGLITIIWTYPRGKAVENEHDPHLIAGVAGVAACLGADFVKVNYPQTDGNTAIAFKEAIKAAGRTGVICAGGKETFPDEFLSRLYDQIHISGAKGNATGRNIHQKSLNEAIRFCDAIYKITVENGSVEEARKVYHGG